MNTTKHSLVYMTLALILFACGNKQDTVEQDSNLIEITSQQFSTNAMQLGKIETRAFESTIKCNGIVVPLPNGIAKVNAPVNGIIKDIKCFNGQSVDRFQPLIEITGSEIIDLQKDFAEASANHKRIKNEYERTTSLYNEKVISEKDFILAETEFRTSLAKFNGFKLKIEAIGFSISKIENGEFYSSFFIKSPIDGYISKLKTNIGSYIDSQTELLEIINPDMVQVKLSIFAKDFRDLKKGQFVRFSSANTKDVYHATISSIGVTIDNESKSIECYASLTLKKPTNPIANEFIEAEIITNNDTVKAFPSNAIIKSENGYYILVFNKQEGEKYLFNKVEVKIGRQHEGFTEITEPKIDGLILKNGVYNITL